ncbi:hypothetical protein B0H19DRAFT_1138746 [Mycena capillaripes]|nr:hypothetical protein B0H19DRAFT_1138746 [Mycena capillaripes]
MHSPFNDMLHTNIAPTDAECRSIRDLLQGPQKDVVDLTEDIARLRFLIDEATRKRDELQQFINAHLALVSPARRLPEDIVREIFMATLSSTRNSVISPDEAPLLLCQICKSWRTVALTTPRLWASVHIVIPTESKLPRLANTVSAWLRRSGTVPLDISLVYSHTSESSCNDSPVVSALVAVSRRWRNIRLVVRNYADLEPLSAEDVPLLQSISIQDGYTRLWDSFPRRLSFLATKSLRSVELPTMDCLLQAPVAWGALIDLKVAGSITCQAALKILHQCPLLETCDVRVDTWSSDNTAQHQPVSLTQLRHLTLGHGKGAQVLLTRMTLPALRSFGCYSDKILFDVRPIFPSSMGHLESLKIDVRKLSSEALLAALSEVPSLEELHIRQEPYLPNRAGVDPDFLKHLTPASDGADSVSCPHLRCLTLTAFGAVSDDTILQFIQARTVSRLQHVDLLFRFTCTLRRNMQRNIIPHLQEAIGNGCVIAIEYDPPFRLVYSPLEGTEIIVV